MKSYSFLLGLLCLAVIIPNLAKAQFNLDGQMLIRSEFRNGYLEVKPENTDPAGFIAHRARLQASYKSDDLNFFMSIQDVRTWGSSSQANLSDNFLSVHEAWGEFSIGEYWKVKLGRQELTYDNARFLGNLDWALQARSHDFALMKYEKDDRKLHLGGGFNQNEQKLTHNFLSTPNQYRTAQFLHYENKLGGFEYSFLFWNEGRQNGKLDSTGNPIDNEVYFRPTLGLPALKASMGKTDVSSYFYYQFGEDITGTNVSAFNASAQVSQTFFENEDGRKWRATFGYEVISGTDGNVTGSNRSYSLQYGTNHIFNGYLDWFFVANRWENSTGLHDIYLRSRYTFSPKFWMQADGHWFSSYAQPLNQADQLVTDQTIGTELDLNAGLIVNDAVSIQAGYSQLFASSAFNDIQSFKLDGMQNWAYLMVVFRPTSKAKFIGVLQ